MTNPSTIAGRMVQHAKSLLRGNIGSRHAKSLQDRVSKTASSLQEASQEALHEATTATIKQQQTLHCSWNHATRAVEKQWKDQKDPRDTLRNLQQTAQSSAHRLQQQSQQTLQKTQAFVTQQAQSGAEHMQRLQNNSQQTLNKMQQQSQSAWNAAQTTAQQQSQAVFQTAQATAAQTQQVASRQLQHAQSVAQQTRDSAARQSQALYSSVRDTAHAWNPLTMLRRWTRNLVVLGMCGVFVYGLATTLPKEVKEYALERYRLQQQQAQQPQQKRGHENDNTQQ